MQVPSDLDVNALLAYLVLPTLIPTQEKGQSWKGYYSHSKKEGMRFRTMLGSIMGTKASCHLTALGSNQGFL